MPGLAVRLGEHVMPFQEHAHGHPLPGTAPPSPLLPAGNPRIIGIVNITQDSFSDGGRYLDLAAAASHARKLRAEGAAEIFAAWQGADYIRTHDVAAVRDALTFLAAVTREAANTASDRRPRPGSTRE